MTIRDATTGDVLRDTQGNVYMVIGRCNEPTLIVDRIWPVPGACEHSRMNGGINGLMWSGFRIVSKAEPRP